MKSSRASCPERIYTMKFMDLNDRRTYTLSEIREEWKLLRNQEPENHASDFKTELFEILMATVNDRNDLEIVGLTHRETDRIITQLRAQLLNQAGR